jgi:NodT family efflux transporter outer membrane factor (OMF) lipoprotein
MSVRSPLPILFLLLASACTVGPDYERPGIAMGDNWIEPAEPGAVDRQWWENFDDPMLVRLVDTAIENSPTLREAEARLAEARANRDAARGGRLPEVRATASATENRLSENGQLPVANIPGFDREFGLFDLGFDAAWELDFWGRQTRQVEAAQARAEAALEARRDTLITLVGEVARAYTDLRVAQAQHEESAAIAEAQTVRAALMEQRFDAGESSRLDRDNAAAAARSAGRAVPEAEAQVSAAAYRIATLIGSPPEQIVPELLEAAPVPESPETILAGVRSDLLTRRPDVRRAERELAAATADIGVATTDLFPRFSLFGSVGQQARNTGDLTAGGSTRFSIGPSFSWPIFVGGRIRAQIRAADARADGAAARYEAAVIGALSDSESAINRFLRSSEAETEAAAALDRRRSAYELTEQRFDAGDIGRLALMAARAALAQAGAEHAASMGEHTRAAISLYKALGGGWEEEEGDNPAP